MQSDTTNADHHQLDRLYDEAPILVSPPVREKRREPRYSARGIACVHAVYPGSKVRLSARVVEISKNGMKLHVRASFQPGTKLHVFLKNTLLITEVRHSNRNAGGFDHGLLIESSC